MDDNVTYICRGCKFQCYQYYKMKNHVHECKEKYELPFGYNLCEEIERLNEIIESNIGIKIEKHNHIGQRDKLLHDIKTKRNYNINISSLVRSREVVLSTCGLSSFIKQTKEDLQLMREALRARTTPSLSEKKIESIILKRGLSALESRLLMFPGFEKMEISADDIYLLRNMYLEPLIFTEFRLNEFTKRLLDYRWALLSYDDILSDMIMKILPRNIIHRASHSSEQEDDPFRFYILDKVVLGKRYWTMDCRLEHLTQSLCEIITSYCVHVFREIYHRIFGCNYFIPDYKKKNVTTRFDCEQLLSNLVSVNTFSTFNKFLRVIVVKKTATYNQPIDENDVFNLDTDDQTQKSRFKSINEKTRSTDVLREMMFDYQGDDNIPIIS